MMLYIHIPLYYTVATAVAPTAVAPAVAPQWSSTPVHHTHHTHVTVYIGDSLLALSNVDIIHRCISMVSRHGGGITAYSEIAYF